MGFVDSNKNIEYHQPYPVNSRTHSTLVYFTHTHWLLFFTLLQKTVRAMYDYGAADNDEVSFKDGDVIVNVQSIDEGWMYGTVQRTGKTGMLPANYVEAV